MLRPATFFHLTCIILIAILLGSCDQSLARTARPSASPTTSVAETFVARALTQLAPTPTPQSTPAPKNYNPLTGLPVENPSLLQFPALLISISHFPVTARPQAGLSFAPYVFEIYITEGATRFLTTFYGQYPAPAVPITGNCPVRTEIFTQTNLLLGNQVWADANQNGIHDTWENGIGGVCVNLYDSNRQLLQQTTTDTNGYYGFNVSPGRYYVAFAKPDGMAISQEHVWNEK